MKEALPETVTVAGDLLSVGVVVGTLVQFLPSAAALFTIIWTAIRIYETDTVRKLLGRVEPGNAR